MAVDRAGGELTLHYLPFYTFEFCIMCMWCLLKTKIIKKFKGEQELSG